jgi:hypothetical protein
VVERLYDSLSAQLTPERLEQALAEGSQWPAAAAAAQARQVLDS